MLELNISFDGVGDSGIQEVSTKDIAIIGLGLQFPEADNYHQFWRNLREGRESVRPIPRSRKKDTGRYLTYKGMDRYQAEYLEVAYLDTVDQFDYQFFDLSPKEASLMDPNQRLFLQTAWTAIEDAGYGGKKLEGSRTGVFVGFSGDPVYKQLISEIEPQSSALAVAGNLRPIIASRLSYLLNLKAPSMVIDTVCSSALVSLHVACQSIHKGECEMAVVGSLNLILMALAGGEKIGNESEEGRSKAFDDDADGAGMGEGVGAVLLKPLSQALEDGDHIYAVIKGSGVNQDGRTMGITAPNPEAQEDVILRAWKDADIDPETISYIEAHGTGTKLGDPIEIDGIQRAFRRFTDKKQFCAIGSAKTNLGHLDQAAGIAGLVKAILALHHKEIPKSLHFKRPNRKIKFHKSPLYVNDTHQKWETDEHPRRCGVSAFGLSGTNSHVVLEEAPPRVMPEAMAANGQQVFTLSAKYKAGLHQLVLNYREHLRTNPELRLADICYTANTGRGHYKYRLAYLAASVEELMAQLTQTEFSETIKLPAGALYGEQHILTGAREGKDETWLTQSEIENLSRQAEQLLNDQTFEGVDPSIELADLYVKGADIDWEAMYRDQHCLKVSLPAYPFEKTRCWLNIPLPQGQAVTEKGLTYAMHWKQQPLAEETVVPVAGTLLLFPDETGVAGEWVQQQSAIGRKVVTVEFGDQYRKTSDTHFVITGAEADYDRLLGEMKHEKITQILHLATVAEHSDAASGQEWEQIQLRGVTCLTHLAGSWSRMKPEEAVDVLVVVANTQKVIGLENRLSPYHAALHATGKMAHLENSRFRTRTVDLDASLNVEELLAELQAGSPNDQVAYRAGVRYVEQLTQIDLDEASDKPIKIKQDGVYVIVANDGDDVALAMLQYLASKAKVRTVLVSQVELSERTLQLVQELEQTRGIHVTVERTNMADQTVAEQLLARLRSSYGQINGVVFSTDDVGAWRFDDSYANNIKTVTLLDRFTEEDELDFFLLFSSQLRLTAGIAPDAPQKPSYFANAWREEALPSGKNPLANGAVLLIHACAETSQQLADALKKRGRQVIEVTHGDHFEKTGDSRYVFTGSQMDYQQLFMDVADRKLSQIVHMASVTDCGGVTVTSELIVHQERGVFDLFRLLRGWKDSKPIGQIEMVLVAANVHEVNTDQVRVQPESAALFGLGKVVALEHQEIQVRAIDIEESGDIEQLVRELDAEKGKYLVAHRNGKRFVEVLEQVELPGAHEPIEIRENGVYLITGGTGGIGLAVAKHLASKCAVKLALLNRSALPPREEWTSILHDRAQATLGRKLQAILDMEQMGSQVLCFSTDIGDQELLRETVAEIEGRFGKVNGVIHGAGLPGGGYLMLRDPQVFANVLRPKVQGTWNLHQLIPDTDFFVSFSSVTSIFGNEGEGDYTAANFFLDAFAAYRNRQGGRAFTINWPTWSETGMAFDLGVNQDYIFKTLSTKWGLAAFDEVLQSQRQNVMVANLNYQGPVYQLMDLLPLTLSDGLQDEIKRHHSALATTEKTFASRHDFQSAALNGFLRTFAAERNARGKSTLSIGWAPWEQAVEPYRSVYQEEAQPFRTLTSNEAVRVLDDLLETELTDVIVGQLSWNSEMFTLPERLPFRLAPALQVVLERTRNQSTSQAQTVELVESKHNVMLTGRQNQEYSHIEQHFAQIWGNVLGFNHVDINDNFFDIGGDSIIAAKIINETNNELQANVQITDLLQHLVFEEFAHFIEGRIQKDAVPESSSASSIKRTEEKEYYPLSSAQKRMYILQQLNREGITYNTPNFMIADGKLDRTRVEQSFQQIVDRHETLRSSFLVIDGEPVQKIHPHLDFSVVFSEGTEEELPNIIRDFVRPFDLSKAPLLRVNVVRMGEEKHALLLDLHHIISDGASEDNFIREFASLYKGLELPELPIQYRDYVAWQQDKFQMEEFQQQEQYWLNQFAGDIPVLSLPTDAPRPKVKSYDGSSISFDVEPEVAVQVRKLAAATGTTQYMLLLAVFNVLLAKYSGQEDIVIGSPMRGRNHVDHQPLIGVFVNTLAMRNQPQATLTFKEFLGHLKENTIKAFANEMYPFEDIIEKLDVERDVSRNPLFDVMFAYQQTDIKENIPFDDVSISRYFYGDNPTSMFDLRLEARQLENTLHFRLEYATKLFKRESIMRMVVHFKQILFAILQDPETKIASIQMLSDQERAEIHEVFNDTAAEYPAGLTMNAWFEEQVVRTPDAVAVIFGEERVTYRELNEKANQLARQLREQGVGADQLVGLLLERSPEMMISILAVLKAGGAYLPIDPHFPLERMRYILEDSAAKWLLTKEAIPLELAYDGTVIDVSDARLYTGDGADLAPVHQARHLAYVIYTSGSTGNPKGAMIEHEALINRIHWMQRRYPIGASDVILQKTPYTFDVSVWELLWWSTQGASVCFLPPGGEKDPSTILHAIEAYNVTTMHFVPSMLHVFLATLAVADNHKRARSLKRVFASGEALPAHHADRFRTLLFESHGTTLHNLYGPTEATIDVSYFDCMSEPYGSSVPIGQPIDNIQLYVVDSERQLLPVGVVGELCIAGVGLARGYLNRPELNAEKFVDNPFAQGEKMYRTGDLAKWLPDGKIEYMGRIDNQVKIRGLRIELGEIENALVAHEAVREVVVLATDDPHGSKSLCAYLVADRELTVGDLRAHLVQTLPEYMVPTYFVPIDAIPVTANGKLDRKRLPKPETLLQSGTEYVAPDSEIEETIVKVWADILLLDQEMIGMHDNFFDIGGNSILLIQLHTQLETLYPGRVGVIDLFSLTTPKLLADFLGRADETVQKMPFQLLDLPSEYFLEEVQGVRSAMFEFAVEGKHYANLQTVAHETGLGVPDVLAALNYYLFAQASGQSVIAVPTLLDEHNRITARSLDLTGLKDFADLFARYKDVQERSTTASFVLKDVIGTRTHKSKKVLLPLVYNKHSLTESVRLLELFDFVLELRAAPQHMQFTCEFNVGKLREEKVQQLISGYGKLLRAATASYQK